MEIKVLFPRTKEEASYLTIMCAASMRSTHTKEAMHTLMMNRPWISECRPEDLKECQGCYEMVSEKLAINPASRYKCPYEQECAERMIKQAKNMHHWGVFEHITLTVSVEGVSRALTHQLVRHRLVSYLQQSQRYVDPTTVKDWYVLPPDWIDPNVQRTRAQISAIARAESAIRNMADVYAELIKAGIKDENARFVLPNACKTNVVITANARQWLHIFHLRCQSPPAQWEIAELMQEIRKKFQEIAPVIFEGAGELDV